VTCIAYREGTLAGDTLWGGQGLKSYDVKVAKKKGFLIGMCGNDCPSLDDILDWYFEDDKKRKDEFKKVDFAIIVVDPDGAIWEWDHRGLAHKVKHEFYAIGSGAHVALGAMEMGADAKQAVKAAIKWADGCGGKVVSKSQ